MSHIVIKIKDGPVIICSILIKNVLNYYVPFFQLQLLRVSPFIGSQIIHILRLNFSPCKELSFPLG